METELLEEDLRSIVTILYACIYVLTGEFYDEISEELVDTLEITEGQKTRLFEIIAEIGETQALIESNTKLFWEK